jgi:hypothetical protein
VAARHGRRGRGELADQAPGGAGREDGVSGRL